MLENLLHILRGLVGIASLLGIAYLFSSDRSSIKWSLVFKGLGLQVLLGLLILKVPVVEAFFEFLSNAFIKVISFADAGTEFLFRSSETGKLESAMVNFATDVLPTIIFFSALSTLLYYWGILQRIVYGLAWLMKRFMTLSGAESLAAAGNVFLGQTTSPLLVKPYLSRMTRSEIMALMSGGMATIAGGVLMAYISFLGGDDPAEKLRFTKHLLTASVMSAPAALVAAKILVPETEDFDKELSVSKEKMGTNALEAITKGARDGLKLAVNVAAMLIAFISLVKLFNYVLGDFIGHYIGVNGFIQQYTDYEKLTFQFLVGYLFAPLTWLIGVAWQDAVAVGQLLGEKTILNEFIAYMNLGEMRRSGELMNERSIIIATYILCGFANFASIGIQVGGIGALVPERMSLLSKLGFKSLIAGTLASLFTGTTVGMLI